MAKKSIRPTSIDEAFRYYEALVKGEKTENPLGLPDNPDEIIELINRAATRAGKLDNVRGRLERITKDARSDLRGKVDPAEYAKLTKLIQTIRAQYEPVPPGVDAKETAKSMAKFVADATLRASLELSPAQFPKEKREALLAQINADIDEEHKFLANDPLFQRMTKDFPITADGISTAFIGPAYPFAVVPVREVLVNAMIAADDPEVRLHAKNFIQMGVLKDGSAEEEFNAMIDAAARRLEKAYFSREVRERRFPIDLVLGSAITSPAFLRGVGLPETLPQNLVWDALSGIKKGAMNLRGATNNNLVRGVVDFFRDRRQVRTEKFMDTVMKKLEQAFGPETGPQVVAGIRDKVQAQMEQIATSGAKREEVGWNIFAQMYDAVRSKTVGLSALEKVAVLYRVQGRKDLMPIGTSEIFEAPNVKAVAESIESALELTFKSEQMGKLSGYWPAYKVLAEDAYSGLRSMLQDAGNLTREMKGEILSKAAAEPFRRKRVDTEVVHATVENIENRIDDLVFRLAAPRINAIVRGASNDAKTAASLVLSATDEFLDNPVALKKVADALAETPGFVTSQLNRTIREFINTAFLTTRAGAWMLIDGMDKTVSTVANVLTRVKSGKAVSLREVFAQSPVPADITDRMISHPFAMESIDVWRPVAWVRAFNDMAFGANKFMDDFANSNIYRLNYGSELKQLANDAGLAVEALGEPARKLAAQRALDSTKDFALAFSFQSAFTTMTPSALMWPYVGFYTKAAGRMIRDLGRVPELFKTGAFGLHKIRESNKEYPDDFSRESVELFGHRTNIPRKFVAYPVYRALADSFFGAPKDNNTAARLEERAKKLESMNNPEMRAQILDNDRDLQDYMMQRTGRAVAGFLQSTVDLQVLPIGPGLTIPGRIAGLLENRTPHFVPGGRPLTNFFQSLGLIENTTLGRAIAPAIEAVGKFVGRPGLTIGGIDPEGFLFPSVQAWNEATFDADVNMEMLSMEMRGEDKKFLNVGGPTALKAEALKRTRIKTLNDLWTNRMLGLGRGIQPEIQGLYNKLQELRGRPDLFVPSDKEVEKIAAITGVNNLELIDMIWRESYLRTIESRQAIKEDRETILDQMPQLRVMSGILASRRSKMAIEEVKDRFDAVRSMPVNERGKWFATDRLVQAFVKSYGGRMQIDQDGNSAFEITFDGNDSIGPMLFNWMQMTQEERLSKFREQTPQNEVVRAFWPIEYEKLRAMTPVPPHMEQNDLNRPLIRQNDEEQTLLRLVPRPWEDVLRSEKGKVVTDLIKDLIPDTPFDFPMSAASVFLEKNQEKIKTYLEKGKKLMQSFDPEKAVEFLMKPFVGEAGAAEFPDTYGSTSEQIRSGRNILTKPETPEERAARDEYYRRVKKLEKLLPEMDTVAGWNKAMSEFKANFEPYDDMLLLLKADPDRSFIFDRLGGPVIVKNSSSFNRDLRGLAVGDSLAREYQATKAELINGLIEGVQDPEYYRARRQSLESRGEQGKTYWDALRYSWPTLTEEVELRTGGHKYQLGFYSLPTFEKGQESIKSTYFDVAFSKPGESRIAWDRRVRERAKKLDPTQFARFDSYMRDKGKFEVMDALQKVRDNQFAVLPLDRGTSRKVDSFKDFLLTNADDVPFITSELRKDPELTELLRVYDPRTYKTVEGKLFGDIDRSAMNYLQSSGFSPEALDYVKRINPNTFSRLFYKNLDFQAVATSLGFQPPTPTAETAVTRERFNQATGQIESVSIPSVLAEPEPMLPDPIPNGTFSSLPNTLQYVARRARSQAVTLAHVPRARLSEEEIAFLDADPSAQVFQTFPGVIGQAFREGKLGPQEVIGQFRGIADYGRITGALDERTYGNFTSFLQNSSNVFGATQFGFRLGQFLDDTFNTPRLPINNPFIDFALAGGPVSGGAPFQPGERLRLPIAPVLVGSQRDPFPSLGPSPQPGGIGEAAAVTTGAAATTSSALGIGQAAGGLPPLGAVFGVISAGFTIANLAKSSRARRRARGDAERARQEAERRRLEAMREAEVQADENLRRQLASQRVREFERFDQERQRDFRQRSERFLRSGANIATFAQQPQEFRNRFIDRFEPEFIEFTRRPQFPSRLNLIESVQSRIPRVRF